jgi:hypothetical protein
MVILPMPQWWAERLEAENPSQVCSPIVAGSPAKLPVRVSMGSSR